MSYQYIYIHIRIHIHTRIFVFRFSAWGQVLVAVISLPSLLRRFGAAIRFRFREWWQAPHVYTRLCDADSFYVYVCQKTICAISILYGDLLSMHLLGGCAQASAFPRGSAANPHHYILHIYTSI